MHLNEITKSSDLVYQAKIFHVTKDTAELEDGKIVQRDVVHHSGGVCVVPLTERQTVLMVQQYRYPFHEVTLEIPAGKREPGEDPLECGLRELREEVGRTCKKYTELGYLYPTPAYDTEVIHMYLAEEPLRSHAAGFRRWRISGCSGTAAGRSRYHDYGWKNCRCKNPACHSQDLGTAPDSG